MTIHSIYIFSKTGTCLYYTEWYRPRSTLSETPEEDRKLMFGLLFSLKQLMNKMNPISDGPTGASPVSTPTPAPGTPAGGAGFPPLLPLAGPDQGFHKYACGGYSLHHLETPTGYRIAVTTDPAVADLRNALWYIYSEIFVGYALKNPMYKPGTPIVASGFIRELDLYMRSLPAFSSR